ncbi:MAG: polynucleotide adenylyltransferase PcnB [Gammaproteobacteria bacterium]|nr:polynucleotide adenylyltransferase PcnB [Gammaproteobacteria bacterium]
MNSIKPTIIPRGEHTISRKGISHNALKVLYRLNTCGYSAYLVGGCVRDLLLGRHPKDYDIATNAHPEDVRRLFRNCRLIGKRFRLAHIIFGKEIIEVATFRTHHKDSHEQHGHSHEGMIIRDNVYGTIEDDVLRRDFTVNALYYNIADYSIVDYMHGMQDINDRMLRMIGDPEQRFTEDPVRLLRAIRFAGKLDLNICPTLEKSMHELSHLLGHVSPARLFQEILKFFQEGPRLKTFRLLLEFQLFDQLFPQTSDFLKQPETITLIESALSDTDDRDSEGKSISPTFLFSVFLWRPILELSKKPAEEDLPAHVMFEKSIRKVLRQQLDRLTIPKRLLMSIHEICFLQYRLTCRYGTAPFRLLEHPRFRAGYDLLIMRAHAGEPVKELCDWWIKFYSGTQEEREELIKAVSETTSPKKKRRRSRKRHKPKVKNDAL